MIRRYTCSLWVRWNNTRTLIKRLEREWLGRRDLQNWILNSSDDSGTEATRSECGWTHKRIRGNTWRGSRRRCRNEISSDMKREFHDSIHSKSKEPAGCGSYLHCCRAGKRPAAHRGWVRSVCPFEWHDFYWRDHSAERGRDIPVDEVCFEEDVWVDWGSVVTQFFLNINDKMRLRIRIKPKTLWRTNISSVEYRGDEVHEGTVEVLLLCFIAISWTRKKN